MTNENNKNDGADTPPDTREERGLKLPTEPRPTPQPRPTEEKK